MTFKFVVIKLTIDNKLKLSIDTDSVVQWHRDIQFS